MTSFNIAKFERTSDQDLKQFYKQFNTAVTEAVKLGHERLVSNNAEDGGDHEVDTGRAISSWEVGVGRRKHIFLDPQPTTKIKSGERIRPPYYYPQLRTFKYDVRKNKNIYISNNVEYLQYLEGAEAAFNAALITIRRSVRNRFTRIKIR